MIKKILLISSNFENTDMQSSSARCVKGVKTKEQSHYPLSLAYLHSVLKKNNFDVNNLFLNSYSNNECFEKVITSIKNFKPNAIGFQMLTNNRVSTFRLLEYIHKKFPYIRLIIGGIHATTMYEQVIGKYPFVVAVLGEGEITLIELLNVLSNNKDLSKVKGIAYYNNRVIKNSPRPPIENLDSLPWPKHEAFFKNSKRNTACILTARGCPFGCSFCCLDTISNRRVRFRSIKNVVDEIEWLTNKYPRISKVWIQDDTFFLDNNRVIEFCNEVLKRKMKKLGFICVARMKPISSEMIEKIVETNFIKVFLGLESANNEILERCHKGVTQEDTIMAYRLFAKTDIITRIFLIIGLPCETLDTIKETINFIKKIQKIKYLHFGEAFPVLMVFPGTEVYKIAKMGGMIDDSYWLTDKPTPVFTLEHTYEELMDYKEIMLNNLSLDRAFSSWDGFKLQFTMMPRIIKYIIKNKLIIHTLSSVALSLLSEKNFILTKKIFHKLKNKQ